MRLELTAFRARLEIARLFAEYPNKRSSRNLLLNFAIATSVDAITDNAILHLSEAIDPALEHATTALTGKSLFTGKGRERRPQSPEFDLLLRIRNESVAHPIRLRSASHQSWRAAIMEHHSIPRFLLVILDLLQQRIDSLEKAGLFEAPFGFVATTAVPRTFAAGDLSRLIEAANTVAEPRAAAQ